MNGIKGLAVLVSIAIISVSATDASAYYHPRLGRFVSRDPGPGGPMRAGSVRPVSRNGFAPRDPSGRNQYADGMNLYQYVRNSPVSFVDWDGAAAKSTTGPSVPNKGRVESNTAEWIKKNPASWLGHYLKKGGDLYFGPKDSFTRWVANDSMIRSVLDLKQAYL